MPGNLIEVFKTSARLQTHGIWPEFLTARTPRYVEARSLDYGASGIWGNLLVHSTVSKASPWECQVATSKKKTQTKFPSDPSESAAAWAMNSRTSRSPTCAAQLVCSVNKQRARKGLADHSCVNAASAILELTGVGSFAEASVMAPPCGDIARASGFASQLAAVAAVYKTADRASTPTPTQNVRSASSATRSAGTLSHRSPISRPLGICAGFAPRSSSRSRSSV
jgi:hypothetical protein